MKLLTQAQFDQLLTNGHIQARAKGTTREHDFHPIVKLFNPCGAATWLLTEIDSDNTDIAWGLCDLGFGEVEFGTVSLSELSTVRGPLGLGIERDLHWKAEGPISAYIAQSSAAGRIVSYLRATEDSAKARP